MIAAVITICACSVAAGFVALRWFIMRHTIANRIIGWLVIDGGKMSKSKGNVVDPYKLADMFGVDAHAFSMISYHF